LSLKFLCGFLPCPLLTATWVKKDCESHYINDPAAATTVAIVPGVLTGVLGYNLYSLSDAINLCIYLEECTAIGRSPMSGNTGQTWSVGVGATTGATNVELIATHRVVTMPQNPKTDCTGLNGFNDEVGWVSCHTNPDIQSCMNGLLSEPTPYPTDFNYAPPKVEGPSGESGGSSGEAEGMPSWMIPAIICGVCAFLTLIIFMFKAQITGFLTTRFPKTFEFLKDLETEETEPRVEMTTRNHNPTTPGAGLGTTGHKSTMTMMSNFSTAPLRPAADPPALPPDLCSNDLNYGANAVLFASDGRESLSNSSVINMGPYNPQNPQNPTWSQFPGQPQLQGQQAPAGFQGQQRTSVSWQKPNLNTQSSSSSVWHIGQGQTGMHQPGMSMGQPGMHQSGMSMGQPGMQPTALHQSGMPMGQPGMPMGQPMAQQAGMPQSGMPMGQPMAQQGGMTGMPQSGMPMGQPMATIQRRPSQPMQMQRKTSWNSGSGQGGNQSAAIQRFGGKWSR